MATKTVVTRIKNKVDTLAKWQAYTGTLLNGEIAVVRVPTGTTYTNPVTGADEPVVELLMKVGDGSTAFANLPWMSAKASDVYDWGKAKTVEFNTSTYKVEFKDASGASLLAVDLTAIDARLDALESTKLDDITVTQSGEGGVVQSVARTATGEITVTNGTVAAGDIASNAVTTAKIKDANVTTDKIADEAVTNDKVAAGVSSDKINIGTDITSGTLTAKLSEMDAAIASKAASSHGTHVTWSTTTPKANGTASVGSETKVARGDHVHPLQTSVSGNAGSANKVNKAVTFTTTGGAAAGTKFDGSDAVTVSYATIGAAPASHDHDDIYYTDEEIDAKVATLNTAIDGKAASDHNHNSVYITPAAVDTKISTALGSVLKYKGTKSSTSALPTSNNATGDVYNITNACAASGTLPKVNAGDNVAWNGSSWDVLAGTVDLSNYYLKSDVDAALETKSDTGHTHNYAGSSSAGGAADSVKASLTFNNGGKGAASGTTFNGSTARTISYNTIGAAPATHSHTKSQITDFAHDHDDRYYTEEEVNSLLALKAPTHDHPYLPDDTKYAGSATQGGAANSVANKLTVKLKSGTTEGTDMFTFDGSAATAFDITPKNIGTYNSDEIDAKLATKQDSGNYAASSHSHGNITNGGTITATALTSASGVGGVVVTDSNNKVTRMSPSTVRSLIGAGTSSLTLGTTATTAAKGNHTHSAYEADITAIEANYLRVDSNNKLVQYASGTENEIIFDCGGAE